MQVNVRLHCLIVTAVAVISFGCQKQDFGLPDRDKIKPGDSLPIDGTWVMKNDAGPGTEVKVKVEKGRVFVLDGPGLRTGIVLAKELKSLDGSRYTGLCLIGTGSDHYETKTTIEVISATEMLEHIEKKEGKSVWESPLTFNRRYTKVFLENETKFAAVHGSTSSSDPIPTNLRLSDTLQRVKAGEEVVTSVLGVDQRITRSHTIDQSADFSRASTVGGTGGLNLGLLSASVTGQIESRRGVNLSKIQTVSREATVSGAVGGRRYKLVWYDLVRDGSVDLPTKLGTETLSFQYKEDAVLEIEVIP